MRSTIRTFSWFFVPLSLVALVMITSAFTNVPTARAASSNSAGRYGYYYITNILNGGNEYDPEYDIILGPHTNASITQSWTASNSFGANVGVSGDVVSAGLNFSVTASYGVSETCSASNTTNDDQYLEWQSVYIDWYYDVYWHSYIDGQNTYQGAGWAKEYVEPRCFFTG